MGVIKNYRDRGDTLIEVLFAITIFSLVAVSSMAIMNQGTDTAQRSLEITLVRQEIDAQAETLRFLNASYIANASFVAGDGSYADQWKSIREKVAIDQSSGGDVSQYDTGSTCTVPDKAFILNAHTVTFINPSVYKPITAKNYSHVIYGSPPDESNTFIAAEGIWVEAVRIKNTSGDVNQSNAGYIDFHIRACWESPGQTNPARIGTIVRLYEPL